MKPSQESLRLVVSSALRFSRFVDAINRLPGAPNTQLIASSRAVHKYKDAVEAIKQAEALRSEAVAEIIEDLQADWSNKDIYKAFNE